MTDNALPEGVDRFVREAIPSINHLEALVRLMRAPDRPLGAAHLADEMRIERGTVDAVLEDLVRSNLVQTVGDAYRYAPATRDVEEAASGLSDAYSRFPVQLIRVIYQQPKTPAESFADAFRLRKD